MRSHHSRRRSTISPLIAGVIGAIIGTLCSIIITASIFASPSKNDLWLMDVVRDAAEQCLNGDADMCESWLLYERDTDIHCSLESDETVCSIKR